MNHHFRREVTRSTEKALEEIIPGKINYRMSNTEVRSRRAEINSAPTQGMASCLPADSS